MAKKDTTSIGFEDKIWKAADVLRGNLNAAEYEGVVLGLIFLKYISDKFEEKFAELSADEYADEEDKDEYTAQPTILQHRHTGVAVVSLAREDAAGQNALYRCPLHGRNGEPKSARTPPGGRHRQDSRHIPCVPKRHACR